MICRPDFVAVAPGYTRDVTQASDNASRLLDGKNIMTRSNLAGHDQAELPHALRTLTGGRTLGLRFLLACTTAVLLVELLLATLPLLLETLDDVDGTADVSGPPGSVYGLGFASLEMREHAWGSGKGLGVNEARTEGKRLERNVLALFTE